MSVLSALMAGFTILPDDWLLQIRLHPDIIFGIKHPLEEHAFYIIGLCAVFVAGWIVMSAFIYVKRTLPAKKPMTRDSFDEIRRRMGEMSTVRRPDIPAMVDYLIFQGIENGASDIHLDPMSDTLRISYRIDGLLKDLVALPAEFKNPFINRLKILANLILYREFRPQDGRVYTEAGGSFSDLRIAFIPTLHGERCVIRIIGSTIKNESLEGLGLREEEKDLLIKNIKSPQGMIILTGPTGCGKTTTIYTMLRTIQNLSESTRSISTLEDPIEIDLGSISQSQVDEPKGFTFSDGLRAILRQDPDVIMVGEIRDPETARIAIQAGMTGHLIITTVHANSSSAAFNRLMEMEIPAYSITTSISAVISQRLVRKLCPECRRKRPATEEEVSMFRMKPGTELMVYDRAGCLSCSDTGYTGRTGVFEVLTVNEQIRELIGAQASADKILQTAIRTGMRSMFENALWAVQNGVTSPEEVHRVLIKEEL